MKTTKSTKKPLLDKILVVKQTITEKKWNSSLPVPLKPLEKVIVHPNQQEVDKGYVRIKHGNPKKISVFSLVNFQTLRGKAIKC